MTNNILFIMLPFPSHFTPCFGLAQTWSEMGKKVYFTGNSNQKDIVEKEKFEFIDFKYGEEYNIKTAKAFLGLFLKSLIDKSFTKQRYRDFLATQFACENLVKSIKPDLIYIDEHLSEYFFYLKKFGIEIKILNTKLSTKKVRGFPPLNSSFKPTNTFFSNLICELIWVKLLFKQKINDFLLKIAFIGQDEYYFFSKLSKKQGCDYLSLIDKQNSFYKVIKSIETIILSPKELEFKAKNTCLNSTYFYKSYKRNESIFFTDKYISLIKDIIERKADRNFKLIYVAFGTLSCLGFKKILLFLKRLEVAFKNQSNILIIVSKSGVEFDLQESKNIRYFNYIPQVDILKYTDLMISHGGLSSLKECFEAKVPAYVLPLNLKVDQNGNAVRFEMNKLGLFGNLEKDSSEMIYEKCMILLKNRTYP